MSTRFGPLPFWSWAGPAAFALACSSHQSVGEQIDDAWISTRIESKLNPFNIEVDTRDGVVTLSGRVADEKRRREALDLARGTRGVVRVLDELQVGGDR